MSALAEISPLSAAERAWRDRMVSLVVTGAGQSEDLSPRFPFALPSGLGIRLGSLTFRADLCVLSMHVQSTDPGALLSSQRELLMAAAWAFPVDEPNRFHARPPVPFETMSLEIERLVSGARVAWWLDEARMTWLMNDDALAQHAHTARRNRRR
jgi:hypothetical protein